MQGLGEEEVCLGMHEGVMGIGKGAVGNGNFVWEGRLGH